MNIVFVDIVIFCQVSRNMKCPVTTTPSLSDLDIPGNFLRLFVIGTVMVLKAALK